MQQDSQKTRLSSIRLIYWREMRDQLRDRRTIFSIAILPMLLYPLLGMLAMNIGQLFSGQKAISVCILGNEHLPDSPPLIVDATISEELLKQTDSVQLSLRSESDIAPRDPLQTARGWINSGIYDAVVLVPEDFKQVTVLYTVTSDRSSIAGDRMQRVLDRWRSRFVSESLASEGIDPQILDPFKIEQVDIAPASTRQTAFWSKLLPFVMFVWAMTGAFYPAIDLVAGEKERGTLETLLCSPALRSEIVWGKLLAVTSFSILTALLNVLSMQVTAMMVFHQTGLGADSGTGAVSGIGLIWLLLALVPLSALFSSLALAIAAMARSSKEGQYYLMPLMMVTLPLVLIPVLPGTTLTVKYTMIPVTGLFLVVKALVEGQYADALMHLPVVAVVTCSCLYLAVRWAQKQFESEQVLFRDGDQLKLGDWLRHLRRDRQPVASTGHAVMCGMVILITLFYGRLVVTSQPEGWRDLALAVMLPQIGMILGPTLIMAAMLTTGLRTSLRIRFPQRGAMLTALVLGFTLHPLYTQFGSLIQYFWPISPAAQEAMAPLMQSILQQPLWLIILVMAVTPAICEELAFRGFIFGGLARNGGGLRAVLVTALMFGFSHAVFQQSLTATVMGCVIGWIALRTGSVLPGIIVHVTNNALTLAIGKLTLNPQMLDSWIGQFLQIDENGQPSYQMVWIIVSASIAVACLMYYSLFNDQDADDREIHRSEQEWIEQQESQADLTDKEERKSLYEVG